jgi:hypothetical protein
LVQIRAIILCTAKCQFGRIEVHPQITRTPK